MLLVSEAAKARFSPQERLHRLQRRRGVVAVAEVVAHGPPPEASAGWPGLDGHIEVHPA